MLGGARQIYGWENLGQECMKWQKTIFPHPKHNPDGPFRPFSLPLLSLSLELFTLHSVLCISPHPFQQFISIPIGHSATLFLCVWFLPPAYTSFPLNICNSSIPSSSLSTPQSGDSPPTFLYMYTCSHCQHDGMLFLLSVNSLNIIGHYLFFLFSQFLFLFGSGKIMCSSTSIFFLPSHFISQIPLFIEFYNVADD